MNHLPILVIIIPLAFAFLSSLSSLVSPRLWKGVVIIGIIFHPAAAAALIARVVLSGPFIYELGGWAPPWGIVLVADELAAVFLVIISAGFCLAFLYSMSTSSDRSAKLFVLYFLAAASSSGWILTGDIFNLFVFVELTSVVCIGIVAFKRRGDSVTAGFVYLVFAALSGMFLLIGIALLYSVTGTLTMAHIAMHIDLIPPKASLAVIVCMILSFGIKIGMVPLHFWMPGAYSAAGSTSAAILSGIIMKAGVYGLLRVVWTVLGGGGIYSDSVRILILAAGCINILTGHSAGFFQFNLKKMLAFSGVAHVGYMLVGFGTGSVAGMAAGIFHALNHFFMKTALFWSSRAFIDHAESPSIFRMQGIRAAAPKSFYIFFGAALAIVGVPPTGGFGSKWLIALSVLGSGSLLPVIIIAAGTAISLFYYGRIFSFGMRKGKIGPAEMESRAGAISAAAVPAVLCLASGFLAGWILPLIETAARQLADPGAYISIVFPGGG